MGRDKSRPYIGSSVMVPGRTNRSKFLRRGTRPDHICFLSLDEEERRRRLHGREGTRTTEESRLADDDAFRQRVIEGYRGLGLVCIDARGTVDEIVESIVRRLSECQRDKPRGNAESRQEKRT